MDNPKAYKRITKNLAQLVSLAKMYKCSHPIVTKKSADAYKEMADFFAEGGQSLVFAKSADMLLINGEKVEPESNLIKKFIEDFVMLDIGSLELETGTKREELDTLILLLCHAEKTRGVDKIKQYFSEHEITHLIARAATFKLVQEDEDIIKKGESVKIAELPPEVLKKFSQDLKAGNVPEKLKGAEKDYRLAAHNPVFLAGLAFDLIKEGGSRDDRESADKVLWLLADYLVSEIGSFKEEDLNRAVLEEIKEKVISEMRDKHGKHELAEHVEKTCAVISTAMELKGLLTKYKKHKKAMDAASKKINNILKNLPQESRLYKDTVKGLEELK